MKTEPLLQDLAAALGSEQAAAQVALSLRPYSPTLPDQPQMTLRPPPPQDPSAPGRLRGEAALVFEGELGRGGMGVVHLATQTSVGRKVAVKRQWPASGLEGTVSLLHEAWITGAVEHPHIVPLYDVATDALGQPLVVLKCIDGTSWRALLGDEAAVRRQYGVVDVQAWHLRTLMQVATAVHFAHQRGIVHRDIKPENVMLGGPGEVYLVDWGIARAFDATVDARLPRLDAREGLVGTPAYMAPEMVNPAEEPVGPMDGCLPAGRHAAPHPERPGPPPGRDGAADGAQRDAGAGGAARAARAGGDLPAGHGALAGRSVRERRCLPAGAAGAPRAPRCGPAGGPGRAAPGRARGGPRHSATP
jgi:hypothetical protein